MQIENVSVPDLFLQRQSPRKLPRKLACKYSKALAKAILPATGVFQFWRLARLHELNCCLVFFFCLGIVP